MNDNQVNLLPCPFCGSQPEIHTAGNSWTQKRIVTIRCPQCRIERAEAALKFEMDWLMQIAVHHWNKRHPAPDAGEEEER